MDLELPLAMETVKVVVLKCLVKPCSISYRVVSFEAFLFVSAKKT
jgi:hypothetical protein